MGIRITRRHTVPPYLSRDAQPGGRSSASTWLVALGLLGLVAACQPEPPSWQAKPIGCAEVFTMAPHSDDLVCVPDDEHKVLIWIDHPPRLPKEDAFQLELSVGPNHKSERIAASGRRDENGTLFAIDLGPEKTLAGSSITVTSKQRWWVFREARRQTLHFKANDEPAWLKEAWRIHDSNDQQTWDYLQHASQQQVAQALTQRVKQGGVATDADRRHYARYLSLLARSACALQHADWERRLRESIEANHDAGLLSGEAEEVLWLSEGLAQRQRVEEAKQFLYVHDAVFEKLAEWRPWQAKQRGLHAALLGDIQSAARHFATAMRQADTTGSAAAQSDIAAQAIQTLASAGHIPLALVVLDKVLADRNIHSGPVSQSSPLKTQKNGSASMAQNVAPDDRGACRDMELQLARLHLWQLARESDPLRPLPDELSQPDFGLQRSSELLKSCDQPSHRTRVHLYRALLALSEHRIADVESAVQALPADQPPAAAGAEEPLLKAFVRGQLALAQKRWLDARAHFTDLLKNTQPLKNVTRPPSQLLDWTWRAQIGLAQAAEHLGPNPSDQQDAQALYQQAEALAQQRALTMPFPLARHELLSRYDRGTGLYVDWLYRTGKRREAFEHARWARGRAIRHVVGLWRIGESSTSAETANATDLNELQKLAQDLTNALNTWAAAAEVDRHPTWAHALDCQRRFEEALSRLAQAPSAEGNAAKPRPLSSGEVMTLCLPEPDNQLLCLSADDQDVLRYDVPADKLTASYTGNDPHPGWARDLIAALQPQLARAQHWTLLSQGPMRQVDWGDLPSSNPNQRIGDVLRVTTALDVPGLPPSSNSWAEILNSPPPDARIYLLIDPLRARPGTYSVLQGKSPQVAQAASALRPHVDLHLGSDPPPGLPTGVIARNVLQIDLSVVLQNIADSAGLVALAHLDKLSGKAADRDSPIDHGRHLETATLAQPALVFESGPGIRLSDLLTLKRAPGFAILLTCSSASSDETWGSAPGLGFAQALLARGTHWVIATQRSIKAEAAAQLATAILTELSQNPDPAKALRRVKSQLRSLAADVDALQVYQR